MKLNLKQKRISNYLFIVLSILMIIMIGCSTPSSSSSKSKKNEDVIMSGSFNLKVDPNAGISSSSSMISYSMASTEYTVTSLEITVTRVSTNSIVGTYNWTPVDGVTTYSVGISVYGEYLISVVQTAVNDGETITTEESITVDIQPNKITAVTIIPGGSLYIKVDGDDSGSSSTSEEFTENFDTTPLNEIPDGFYTEHAGDNIFVGVVDSEITPHSLPNCLKLYDNNISLTEYANIFKDIDYQSYGQLTFYLYIAASSPWAETSIGGAIYLYFQDAPERDITITQPDSTAINIGTYTAETWNKVTIKWDAYTFKYKVFLNDVDLGTYSFVFNYIPSKMLISATQGLNVGHLNYIDDITFTTNPESIN